MSQLQKAIRRVQRREGRGLGFAPVSHDKPRAMLLATLAEGRQEAAAAAAAGVDVILLKADTSEALKSRTDGLDCGGAVIGALLPALDSQSAEALREAGCDFVVSPLGTTSAAAVDQERMGQVISLDLDVPDTVLRSLSPLSPDALFVEAAAAELTLAGQLDLVRLASLSSTPLLVAVGTPPSVPELRVLRDSGVAGIVMPAGTAPADLERLGKDLKAVPPPRRPRGPAGSDIALVPSAASVPHEPEPEPDEEDG